MSPFLLWLAGADFSCLARCRSEQARLIAMGGAILSTSILAATAGTRALHEWLHMPLVAALCGGLFWGVSIMNLDRWVVLTLRRQATPPRTIALAAPRVLLAVVIGVVISGPLVLDVFHNEVTARALQDRQADLAKARAELEGQYSQIHVLGREQSEQQAAASASPVSSVLAGSKDFAALSAQLKEQQDELRSARQQAICELDGTCGTHHIGAGPAYRAKSEQANELSSQAAETESRLRSLEDTLVTEAKSDGKHNQDLAQARLEVVDSELATLRKQYDESEANLVARYGAPIGLLDRIQALGELSSEHPAMTMAELVLIMFVLLLDSIPVCFKTLTLMGDPTLYEQIQRDSDERRFRRYELAEEQGDAAARIEAGEILAEATLHAKLNRAEQEERLRKIVDIERGVTRQLIAQLRARAMRDVPDLVETYASRRDRLTHRIRTQGALKAGTESEPHWDLDDVRRAS
jgi:hypothetical protein